MADSDDSPDRQGDEEPPDEAPPSTFNPYDALSSPNQRPTLRAMSALVIKSLRLVIAAGRRELLTVAVIQALTGVGAGVQLLIGRQVLRDILAADRTGGHIGSIVPQLALLAAVLGAVSFLTAAATEKQRVLSELVSRYAFDRILDVATTVDCSADRIYVLDKSRIAESGSHDDLMANRGLYSELFTLQAAAYLAPTDRD